MAKKPTPTPTQYTVTDGKLTLVLVPDESGGYIVTCPDDSDIVTQADTIEEAFDMARDAISLFQEDRAAELKAKQSAKKRGLVKKSG